MKGILVIALCAIALAAAGCGGDGSGGNGSGNGGGPRLTKAAYQAKLTAISAQAKTDQLAINQAAATAKTVAALQAVLTRYAAAGDRFGNELGKLNPPANAASANAALAKGEHDNANEIRTYIPKLAKYKTAQAALTYLESVGGRAGSQEVKTALDQLKALGYTTGA